MLRHKIPECVVHSVIEIGDCDLHPPVVLVIQLHMPMDSNGTHVASTLNQGFIVARFIRS